MCRRRQYLSRTKYSTLPCVPIESPALVQPDPLIYSQYFLNRLGLAVSWDNPDIQIHLNSKAVSSSSLQPSTEYEIVAQIWNGSPFAPVIGMQVHFSFLEFGIGTVHKPIGSKTVNLGVKGLPPVNSSIQWTTPSVAGHYCIQVLLNPYDDSNPDNNLGQENINVIKSHSPANSSFTLRNDTDKRRTYHFEIDTYESAEQSPCNGTDRNTTPNKVNLTRHRIGSSPIPSGWQVIVFPNNPSLDPAEVIQVEVTIVPPERYLGTQNFNINAFYGSTLAGGVTFTFIKDH